ncbi:ribosome biogenesis GTPase YlqF [Virgibacillus kimchii]
MTIQWFPGHMAKAKKEIEEKLKLVDFVIELVDARAPLSSHNPMLEKTVNNKPKMKVLMKKDLADSSVTQEWVDYFKERGAPAVAINVNEKADIIQVIQLAKEQGQKKMEKLKQKGIQPRPARGLVLGIPNVGKSTLINRLANKKIAKTGDRPGITRQQLWIKVKKDFELLDTPGILWPKFEEETVAYRLAAIGTIKDQLLPLQEVAAFVIDHLQRHYPHLLEERYSLDSELSDMYDIFTEIGKNRGALESGGKVNFDKVADLLLRDLRTGKIGSISMELPGSDLTSN